MKIVFSQHFKKQLKSLKKKYPSIFEDCRFALNNFSIKSAKYIGSNIYKIRIKSSDQRRGKSGGFRSYLHFIQTKGLLFPVCIYSKSEKESISVKELRKHNAKVIEELKDLIS